MIHEALRHAEHLIRQGKTRDDALAHAAHRYGVLPARLRESYEFNLSLAEVFRDITDDWFTFDAAARHGA